ncbi:ankyrin repeat-containing domain protein [Boeremia exigua]|uniref:ankyrin repeat-containing domain protein n=1 Tax=Boeremia exigua TaxID=749465 RepID=UPI001E8EC1B6|nr:ankyrin repeat-containing domain protein [Boeremia exigua]KAH6644233.1 ankyrin repeat-containing domain protein [Boeremia exigua]
MSSAPTLGLKTPLPPRRRRAPRKLNYNSCASCRSASAKCLQGTLPWPGEKCRRCTEKNLICSAPVRKSEEDEVIRDAIALAGVTYILEIVVKELERLGDEYSELSSITKAQTKARFELCSKNYMLIKEDIEQKITDLPSTVEDIVHTTRDSCYLETLDGDGSFGQGEHLYGIVMVCMIDCKTAFCPSAVAPLMQDRKGFLQRCVNISGKYKFGSSQTHSILRTSLFLPSELLQIPAVWNRVRHDTRTDCLGRSVWCMAHDAGVRMPWPVEHLGDVDLLGRSAWYLACARQDTTLLDQLLAHLPVARHIPGSNYPPKDVIRAAASYGYTAVFQSLYEEDSERFCARIGAVVDERGLNSLHIAVKKGHRSTVEFLCQHLPSHFVNRRGCKEQRTALHYAAMYGHEEVVPSLIDAISKDRTSDPRDSDYRSAFWWAAWAGSVEVLKLLQQHWSRLTTAGINDRDVQGHTPLTTSIINNNGSLDVARYLLSLNSPTKLRIDINRQNDMASQTPLDIAYETLNSGDCDEDTMTAFIKTLVAQGALTYQEIEEREMWDEEVLSGSECSSEVDDDEMRHEQMDDEMGDLMDVVFDFDLFFAQNPFDHSPNAVVETEDDIADVPGPSTVTSMTADSHTSQLPDHRS